MYDTPRASVHTAESPAHFSEWRPLSSRLALVALMGLALIGATLVGCVTTDESGGGPRGTGRPEPTELEKAQVREYEGKNLASIGDFRENSIKGPQQVDRETYRLTIGGLATTPLELTYDQVLSAYEPYKKVVRLNCVEGWSVDILWEGIKVADLLDSAGADTDARVIIFRSVDGYSTSLPASYIRDNDILLAYKMNGVELPPERGFPFQVVAEDKWGYKWAKWIDEIEVSDDTSFKGYWEERGYSNKGDLDSDSRGE